MKRFDGIGKLYGPDGLACLARSHVLVVGLGGVGSWVVEALARSGVGALTLVDGDDVCVSNINRQLHAVEGAIGRPKAEVMAERVRIINPLCRVQVRYQFFMRQQADDFFPERYAYVVDAADGVTSKATLIGHARQRGLPVLTCGAAGGKVDPGRVEVADLADVHHDRLLMFTRKLLRKYHGFTPRGRKPFGVPAVFSAEPLRMGAPCGPEAADREALFGEEGTRLACDGRLGAASFVTGVFGFVAAARVVNDLAAMPDDEPNRG
jgi:tRNA A37 threonylcarbamoyladenosine dehydratase